MKTIVILGTARKDSNTENAIRKLCPFKDYELIDLQDFEIGHYEYNSSWDAKKNNSEAVVNCENDSNKAQNNERNSSRNDHDDFIKIALKMAEADHIVFATPVYWYTMSARLKIFFDRLTDLLYNHKELGKSLKGKKTYLIASGSDPNLPEGFEVPFRNTSEYFHMTFEKSFYLSTKI